MTLQKTLEALAADFARNLMTALRSASLAELTDAASASTIPINVRGGGVRHVDRNVLALTGLLSTRPGLRAEHIRAQLRWDKKTTTKAITSALAGKQITKKGQKRSTSYDLA
jgi:hypothetical protein